MPKRSLLLEALGAKDDKEGFEHLQQLMQPPVTITVTWSPVHGMSIVSTGRPTPEFAQQLLFEATKEFVKVAAQPERP